MRSRDFSLQYRARESRTGPGLFGNRLEVSVGIRNLLDTSPPTVDTLIGFIGGSPLGCAFDGSLRMPLWSGS